LAQKAVAEALGTGFLTMAVIGSGIAAARLSPGDIGLQLLQNSITTGAALTALILVLQPVSAAFNPVVTVVDVLLGSLGWRHAVPLAAAQLLGAAAGAVLANLMFGLDAITVSGQRRDGGGLWLAEVVATIGLLLVIFGAIRTGRKAAVGCAVGGYVAAAYWFTSSTSFANPALTVARTLSDTFAGIAPASVPLFVLMQLLGGALAFGLIRFLWPSMLVLPSAKEPPHDQHRPPEHAQRPVHVCPQRWPVPDGGRLPPSTRR